MSSSAILENATVKLATLIATVFFFCGGAWKVSRWMTADALWKNNLEHEIEKTNLLVKGKDREQWRKPEMRIFTQQLRNANPALKVPQVDNISVN